MLCTPPHQPCWDPFRGERRARSQHGVSLVGLGSSGGVGREVVCEQAPMCLPLHAGFESPAGPAPSPSAPPAPPWQGRSVASSKLWMLEFSAFQEQQQDPDTVGPSSPLAGSHALPSFLDAPAPSPWEALFPLASGFLALPFCPAHSFPASPLTLPPLFLSSLKLPVLASFTFPLSLCSYRSPPKASPRFPCLAPVLSGPLLFLLPP